jgi:uncharacterized protein (DUF3084 family)
MLVGTPPTAAVLVTSRAAAALSAAALASALLFNARARSSLVHHLMDEEAGRRQLSLELWSSPGAQVWW